MKVVIHKSEERGMINHGWLQANYSFSFSNYYDPKKLNFGALRVLNDDIIAPKMGFGTHPHQNMEIITIPLSGELKHRDSMHNEWQSVFPGEVQIMSAGTGVEHSEINGSLNDHLNLFQIWIIPSVQDVAPRYDQKKFNSSERKNTLQTLVSGVNTADDGSLKINQDAKISRIDLDENQKFNYHLTSEHHGVYVMIIDGEASVSTQNLKTRDAVGVFETKQFSIETVTTAQLIFIEVPMLSL